MKGENLYSKIQNIKKSEQFSEKSIYNLTIRPRGMKKKSRGNTSVEDVLIRHINLLGYLMPNQVKKWGTEKFVMLEFICRETICRKNLVSLKVFFFLGNLLEGKNVFFLAEEQIVQRIRFCWNISWGHSL